MPLKRTTKSLLIQLHQLRSDLDDSDDDCADDIDVYVGYRRPEVVKDKINNLLDDDLPEDIQWKLFLIRQRALALYREKWT